MEHITTSEEIVMEPTQEVTAEKAVRFVKSIPSPVIYSLLALVIIGTNTLGFQILHSLGIY